MKTINDDVSKAKRMLMARRTPIATLIERQRERLAKIEERLARLMSLRAVEEETLAELIELAPPISREPTS